MLVRTRQPAHLEQRHRVQLRRRHRPVSVERQRDHAQPRELQRARLQPRLLSSRPGLGRSADVRAELAQRRRVQLDDARRRRSVPLGRPEHDGHRRGRRERQSVLRKRFQFRADERHGGDVQPQHVRRAIASRDPTTDCGAATASTRASSATSSCATASAIAIEHGQKNNIIAAIDSPATRVAIYLWANPIEPSDWGYPKHRDTRSRDYVHRRQHVHRQPRRRFASSNTTGDDDSATASRASIRRSCGATASRLRDDQAAVRTSRSTASPAPIRGAHGRASHRHARARATARRSSSTSGGRTTGVRRKLWPVDTGTRRRVRLRVLGPAGTWRVVERRGIVAALGERRPRRRHDHRDAGRRRRLGDDARVSRRGRRLAARRDDARRAGHTILIRAASSRSAQWDVRVLRVDRQRPTRVRTRRPSRASNAARRSRPLDAQRLDYFWYRPTIAGMPQEKWAAVATARVTLGSGAYTLRTISDDAVRVWIDGPLAIDDWAPHESAVDYAPIARGATRRARGVLPGRRLDRAARRHRARGVAIGGVARAALKRYSVIAAALSSPMATEIAARKIPDAVLPSLTSDDSCGRMRRVMP